MKHRDQSGCILMRRLLHQRAYIYGQPPDPHVKQLCADAITALPRTTAVLDPVMRIDNGDAMDKWFNLRLPLSPMWVEGLAPGIRCGSYAMKIEPDQRCHPNAKHTIGLISFIQRHGEADPVAGGIVAVDTDDNGDAIDIRPNASFNAGVGKPDDDRTRASQAMSVYAAVLTIGMMNDPKVTTVELNHDRALRKRQRHLNIADANERYRVLILRDQLERIGGKVDPANPGNVPLHVVKGHWGRYGVDGRTGLLFGRIPGRFWFDESSRGDPKYGTVHTDYKLAADKDRKPRSAAQIAAVDQFADVLNPHNRDVQQPQRQEAK